MKWKEKEREKKNYGFACINQQDARQTVRPGQVEEHLLKASLLNMQLMMGFVLAAFSNSPYSV